MKNKLITIVVLFVLLLSFIGCDKYHRNRYVGNWDFVTERIYYEGKDWANHIEVKRDTVIFSGKISLGSYDGELLIQYTEKNEITLFLDSDRDGYFYSVAPPCPTQGCTSGMFENNDKMNLYLYWGLYTSFESPYDSMYEDIHGNKKGRRKK